MSLFRRRTRPGFQGYVKGSATAPVEITEYADYQCPFCQTFATLQMPTIEERLINTGRLRWRYRDFRLQQHPFARLAAHSAACADEQGKYWDQHQRIYEGQSEWTGARGTRPRSFESTPQTAGLDLGRYDACMKAGQVRRPDPGRAELGSRAGRELDADAAGRTGGCTAGRFDSDAITKLVDSLARHVAQ